MSEHEAWDDREVTAYGKVVEVGEDGTVLFEIHGAGPASGMVCILDLNPYEYGQTVELYDPVRVFMHLDEDGQVEVHGVKHIDHEIFYRTPDEQAVFESNRAMLREQRLVALDERYDALPDTFKTRIDMRRERSVNFRQHYEDVELKCCEGAVRIADYIENAGGTDAWVGKPTLDLLEAMVDAGDTFFTGGDFTAEMVQTSAELAYEYLTAPDTVPMLAGAMAHHVGDEEYGEPIDLMDDDDVVVATGQVNP